MALEHAMLWETKKGKDAWPRGKDQLSATKGLGARTTPHQKDQSPFSALIINPKPWLSPPRFFFQSILKAPAASKQRLDSCTPFGERLKVSTNLIPSAPTQILGNLDIKG